MKSTRVSALQFIRPLTTYLCLVLLISGAQAFDYCTIPCIDGQHTMCLFPTEDLGMECVEYDKERSVMSQQRKDDIVDSHNKLRSDVAMGKETRGMPGPQPPAANMMQIEWDTELELIAQRYAKQCTYDHDKCRTLSMAAITYTTNRQMSTITQPLLC